MTIFRYILSKCPIFCSAIAITSGSVKSASAQSDKNRIKDTDVLIIGGGIVGTSLAYYLSQLSAQNNRSLSIAVLDKGYVGSGASGLSAGTIWNPGHGSDSHKQSHLIEEVCANSMDMYETLEGKGYPCGLNKCGVITLACSPEEAEMLRTEFDHLSKSGYNVEYLSSQADIVELEPGMTGTSALEGIHTPLSGYIDPMEATVSVAAAASDLGAHVHELQTVHALFRLSPPVSAPSPCFTSSTGKSVAASVLPRRYGICTTSDDVYTASHVVIASGIALGDPLHSLGLHVPIYPVKGTMVQCYMDTAPDTVSPVAYSHQTRDGLSAKLKPDSHTYGRVSKVIYVAESQYEWASGHQPAHARGIGPLNCTHALGGVREIRHCYGRPDGSGGVLFGGGRIPTHSEDTTVEPSMVEDIYSHAIELYPLMQKKGQRGGMWSGLMPFADDGRPIVGPVGGQFSGLWVAGGFGGSGMTKGPGCMQFLAQQIFSDITGKLHTRPDSAWESHDMELPAIDAVFKRQLSPARPFTSRYDESQCR